MKLNLTKPLTYLITDGSLPPDTPISQSQASIAALLELITAAARAELSLIQIREKHLSARALYELTCRAAALVRDSSTRLLINDRADIARAAGAHGVHLTTHSLHSHIIRHTFGTDFLIGVSTHTLAEAQAARDGGADFATFSPIFATPSKRIYDLPPAGLDPFLFAHHELASFPLLALGGIETTAQAKACLNAGAHGIAAIRLFGDATTLANIAHDITAHGVKSNAS